MRLRRFYGGALPSPPDHRDLLYAGRHVSALSLNNDVTALDTGEIWNQGQEGSCTAWSLLDAAAAAWRKANGTVPEKLSAALQYFNARRYEDGTFPQDAGCTMRGAAKALADFGCCYESEWPYVTDGSQVDDLPPSAAVAAAGAHKLITYVRIAGTGQALLNGALSALQDGYPVWIAFNVYPSFESVGADGRIPMRQPSDYVLGGHATTLWDSIADQSWAGGGSSDMKNQWGYAWANGGRARMPWGYFIDGTILEAWIIKTMLWADAPPAPEPEPEPEPEPAVWQGYLDDVDGIHDEGQRLVTVAQLEFAAALAENRPPAYGVMNGAVGPLWDYLDQVQADAHALAGYIPKVDPPPPDPPPPPPDPWHGRAAGFYARQRYGNGARQWGNLTIPNGTPRGVLVQVHGGGWMQGDPFVATQTGTVPLDGYGELLAYAGPGAEHAIGLQQMASYAAARWGVVVWEPAYTYSTGNPEACLGDVKAAIRWLVDQLAAWGGAALPVVYAGHSAGGQLSLRAALDPTMPAPHAWLGMAAAGLTVHRWADVQDAPGGSAPGGTSWIFQTAWGADTNRWPAYAPDSYLQARAERFPLYIEQGSLNGHDDGSVNVRWARDFAGAAGRAGWPGKYREQAGVDHYAVRWDQSPQTRADMDTIWGG